MDIRITPPDSIIEGSVRLPLSKSVLNRAYVIDTIGGYVPEGFDEADGCSDVAVMAAACSSLYSGKTINVADSGTALRFITALCAVTDGCEVVIDGTERLRQRPVAPLVDALRQCGADIEYADVAGFAPLRVCGKSLKGGKSIKIDAGMSSQFVSAMLLVAPSIAGGLIIELDGPVKSQPYVALTVDMMRRRGIEVVEDGRVIEVKPGKYSGRSTDSYERDWSALAFWAELTAVSGGYIDVPGLNPDSIQGDRRLVDIFSELGVDFSDYSDGVLHMCGSPDLNPRLNYDFCDCPDLVPAAVVTCVLAGLPFKFTGIAGLRLKESDRIDALVRELYKIGAELQHPGPDILSWEGEHHLVGEIPVLDSHNDHRIAMALASISLFIPGIVINGAECVAKSYPRFWEELAGLGFIVDRL